MNIKLLAATAVMIFSGAASANEVANGDFASGALGWDVRSGTVAFAGEAALALGGGSFDQTLSLSQDTTYRLTFSSVGSGFVDLYSLDYALSTTAGEAGTTSAISFANGANYTYYFTTDSSQQYITTKLLFGSAVFAAVDNVSVTAVPEPGAFAMLLAGLGAVGFMTRRRKI